MLLFFSKMSVYFDPPKYLLYKYKDLVYLKQILFLCPHGHNVTTAKLVINLHMACTQELAAHHTIN